MFSRIIEEGHTVNLEGEQTLLKMAPMCRRRVMLFMKSRQVLYYDLHDYKVISSMKLDGLVIQAKALTNNELVCTLDNGTLIIIDTSTGLQARVLASMALRPQNNKQQAENIYTNELLVFKENGSFLLKKQFTNNIVLHYYGRIDGKIAENYTDKTIQGTEFLIQTVNERDTIAVFGQYPEAGNRWTVRFYNIRNSFKEQIYRLENDVFKDKVVVQTIQQVSNGQYIIAVNADYRVKFLTFNPLENQLVEFNYKPSSFMEGNNLINLKTGVMMVPRMFRDAHNGAQYDNIIDLVALETGDLLSSYYFTLQEHEESWECNYILSYSRPQNARTKQIKFSTLSVISKQSTYLKFMKQLSLADRYGEVIYSKVLSLLD